MAASSHSSHTQNLPVDMTLSWGDLESRGKGIGITVQILPVLGWPHDFSCLYYNNFGVAFSSGIIIIFFFVLFGLA